MTFVFFSNEIAIKVLSYSKSARQICFQKNGCNQLPDDWLIYMDNYLKDYQMFSLLPKWSYPSNTFLGKNGRTLNNEYLTYSLLSSSEDKVLYLTLTNVALEEHYTLKKIKGICNYYKIENLDAYLLETSQPNRDLFIYYLGYNQRTENNVSLPENLESVLCETYQGD